MTPCPKCGMVLVYGFAHECISLYNPGPDDIPAGKFVSLVNLNPFDPDPALTALGAEFDAAVDRAARI